MIYYDVLLTFIYINIDIRIAYDTIAYDAPSGARLPPESRTLATMESPMPRTYWVLLLLLLSLSLLLAKSLLSLLSVIFVFVCLPPYYYYYYHYHYHHYQNCLIYFIVQGKLSYFKAI